MAAATTPAGDTSVMDDIIEIFYAPSRVFARRRDNPKFWTAFVIASVLIAVGAYLMAHNLPNMMDEQLAKAREKIHARSPQLTDDQISQTLALQAKFAPVGYVLGGPILITVLSIVLWLIGRLFDGRIDLKQAFMVGSLASLTRFIDSVLAGVLGMAGIGTGATNPYIAAPSLARIAPAGASPIVLALLSRFSIGVIWATIIIAIGYHVVARMPKGRAYLAAGVLWLIGTGFVVFGARQLL